MLEVASGTGQHAAFFAAALPETTWQPTDRDEAGFASITRWAEMEGARNMRPPVCLDVTVEPWRVPGFQAIYCANMIHIAPWEACLALLRGAGRHLPPGGPLVLYGPYKIDGEHTAPSNAAFDLDLRARDPSWGVRDLEAVATEAHTHALDLEERVSMPANNQIAVFRRRSGGDEGTRR